MWIASPPHTICGLIVVIVRLRTMTLLAPFAIDRPLPLMVALAPTPMSVVFEPTGSGVVPALS